MLRWQRLLVNSVHSIDIVVIVDYAFFLPLVVVEVSLLALEDVLHLVGEECDRYVIVLIFAGGEHV